MRGGSRHFSGMDPVLTVLDMPPQVRFDTSPRHDICRDQRDQYDDARREPEGNLSAMIRHDAVRLRSCKPAADNRRNQVDVRPNLAQAGREAGRATGNWALQHDLIALEMS